VNGTLVSWQPDMVDLSSDDSVTLAGITIVGDGIGVSVRDTLAGEHSRILAEHGPRAFDNPKEAAAIHEAGHVVAHTAMGGRVRRASIACHALGGWIGYTEYRGSNWNISPQSAAVAKWLNVSRNLYAGIAAEMLFDPDPREGSSLDEVLMSQFAGHQGALIADEDPKAFWGTNVHYWLRETLEKHRETHAEITTHLMRHGKIDGRPLNELCAKVRSRS